MPHSSSFADSPVPALYRRLLTKLEEVARQALLDGGEVSSAYFIGSTAEDVLQAVPLDTNSTESKERSAHYAKRVATYLDADFAVLVSECWALPSEQVGDYDAIMAKYGSLANYPKHIDQLMLSLETRHGWFFASAAILAAPPSKKRRKLGALTWSTPSTAAGRLTGIIPKLP